MIACLLFSSRSIIGDPFATICSPPVRRIPWLSHPVTGVESPLSAVATASIDLSPTLEVPNLILASDDEE